MYNIIMYVYNHNQLLDTLFLITKNGNKKWFMYI